MGGNFVALTQEETQRLRDICQVLRAEVHTRADRRELDTPAFVDFVLDALTESGEWPQHELSQYRHRTYGELEAWGIDEDHGALNLAVAAWSNEQKPQELDTRTVTSKLGKALKFLEASVTDGLADRIEESTEVAALARTLPVSCGKDFTSVRISLLSNQFLPTLWHPPELDSALDIGVHLEVWDLGRIGSEIGLGKPPPPVEIDFEERFGNVLPCLTEDPSSTEASVHVAFVPGWILGQISHDYGPRLLESNVRTYLQAGGKVNKGILETVANEPQRFLLYNNGITCTAHKVELDETSGGIRRVVGFQVVNGGQTTSSLGRAFNAEASKGDASERLAGISVQMKLVEVPPSGSDSTEAEALVSSISRFANRQNAVSEADLSAHHPFQIAFEGWAKQTAVPVEQAPVYWFYERLRGRYQSMLLGADSAAEKKKLKERYPAKLKILKTDLAKYHNSWDQRPWVVSLGTTKCHKDFMDAVDRGSSGLSPDPDLAFFKEAMGKAILFRKTEAIYKELDLGVHRADTVTYSIAFLSRKLHRTLDFESVWETQALEPRLEEAMAELLPQIRDFLIETAGDGLVHEWARKEEAWEALMESEVRVDLTGVTGTTPLQFNLPNSSSGDETITGEQEAALRWVQTLELAVFKSLLEFALDAPEFKFNDKQMLSQSAGRALAGDQIMTPRQAHYFSNLHQKATELGWQPNG